MQCFCCLMYVGNLFCIVNVFSYFRYRVAKREFGSILQNKYPNLTVFLSSSVSGNLWHLSLRSHMHINNESTLGSEDQSYS